MTPPRSRTLAATLALLPLAACSVAPPVTPDESFPEAAVVLDGSVHDWPEDAALVADAHYLYFRVAAGDDALQASPTTVALWIDLDADASTGYVRSSPPPARDMGIDLEIQFSPAGPDGQPGLGVAIYALGPGGGRTEIGHDEADFMFTPTYAAEWHEGRISRAILDTEALAGVGDTGEATAMVVVLEGGMPSTMWSDAFGTTMPASEGARPPSFAVVPAHEPGTIRVMSWNVLRDSPIENAAPFARVIDAADPDIVLLQEWDYTGPQLEGWFTALVDAPRGWHAVASDAWGVALVSRHRVERLGHDLEIDGNDVRFVAGVVSTPLGPVAVGSAHLKCCGPAGGPEDARRAAEAALISESLGSWAGDAGVGLRVVAGDLNLVGTRTPLDDLRAGLDADGSDMDVVETYVLGDAAAYTWSDAESPFSPGRLDYAVASDATMEVVRAFVLDTRRLSDEALARMGLQRGDSAASDHMPLIIDLRPR